MQESNNYKIIYDLDEIFSIDGDSGYELKTNSTKLDIEIGYVTGGNKSKVKYKLLRFDGGLYFFHERFFHYSILSHTTKPIHSNLLVEYEGSKWRDILQKDLTFDEFHHYQLVLTSAKVVINVLAISVEILDVD